MCMGPPVHSMDASRLWTLWLALGTNNADDTFGAAWVR